MNYIGTLLAIAVVCVASAAALNWTVDPAGIFRATSFGQMYAKALVISKYGLTFPQSLDEREFKTPLANLATQADCFVIGSSRIMQVGSSRKYRSFPDCENLVNLGVSGAVIQDHVVLTWLALSKNKPRNLILAIDPWTFAYGNDERWKIRYPEHYQTARMEIDVDATTDLISSKANLWSNLLNAQYTKRSLGHLLGGTKTSSIVPAIKVDEDFGGETSVVLPDGSLIYSAKYISEARQRVMPLGAGAYKVDGVTNDPRAVRLYQRLIMYAKTHGVQVTLMLSPYHQNAWLIKASADVKAMAATEVIVRKMGNETGVAVIGSFRPELTGCLSDEFFDLMHPMAKCMARLTASTKL